MTWGLRGEGKFNRPTSTLAQDLAKRLKFFTTGVPTGQRPALVADVVVEDRSSEAKCAGIDRVAQELLHAGNLLGVRGSLEGLFSHHIVSQRRERGERGDVNTEPAFLQHVEVFSVALPLPINAALHHLEGDSLNIDQIPHQNVPQFRSDRRDADSTVAHDYGGDAVPRGASDQWVPSHLSIVMSMW